MFKLTYPKFVLLSTLLPALITAKTNQSPVLAQSPSRTPDAIPSKTLTVNGKTVQVPDFDLLTFDSLPPTTSSGSFTVPQKVVDDLGFDPSTAWVAGQKPETFLKLGSVSGLSVQKLSIEQIGQLTNTSPSTQALDKFQPIATQSADSLVQAIPGLADTPLQDVGPLSELFQKYGVSSDIANSTVGNAVQSQPEIAKKLLGKELDLSKYQIKDIPGLEKVPLQELKGWSTATVAGIPSLSQVQWKDFPTPPPGVIRTIAPIDFTWSEFETMSSSAIPHVISGSIEPRSGLKTIPVPPPIGQKIPYVELADYLGRMGPSYGGRWFAGTQQVSGGYGILKAVNGGLEPTGLATYGPLFKVSLDKTDETKGMATFNISFRFCMKTALFDYGCTPYCLATIPWIPARETEAVPVTASYGRGL